MGKYHKMTYLSLLVTFGIALHIIESTLPFPLPVPGAKLGLANIISLMAIVLYGLKEGLAVALLRSVIGSLLGGSMSSLVYSLSAAMASTLAMYIAYRNFHNTFSLVGISIIGGVAHNFTQITVASLMLSTIGLYAYLPFLLVIGLFTCFFTGLAAIYIRKNLLVVFDHKKPQGGERET